jgi:hypothetical protein
VWINFTVQRLLLDITREAVRPGNSHFTLTSTLSFTVPPLVSFPSLPSLFVLHLSPFLFLEVEKTGLRFQWPTPWI